ncbi:MAG: adenylate/guanylate cyclase domain-containing protein [Spirochaetota bacterium]|nr:adenylate/guanylate cyclase domain-containing protein [Spirochaetota bacterium]
MKIIMFIMQIMMLMIPRFLRKRIKAGPLGRKRLKSGLVHPNIDMNLENLLTCMKYCGTCPSYPGNKMEALFCASGESTNKIEENGCNCVSCPLYEQCSQNNTVYFCKYGSCSGKELDTSECKENDNKNTYLEKFLGEEDIIKPDHSVVTDQGEVVDVTIDFIGDKLVETKSDIPILEASLNSGIEHTHVCGGRARCSTCRVIVTEGLDHCRPRNENESALAKMKGFSPDVRLACQTTVDGDISIRRLVLDKEDIAVAINEGRSKINDVSREIEATILFSDIRSFTSFSEKSLPYDIVHILNRYFDALGDNIDSNGGYIDKYMGDGIMAIFGLDQQSEENSSTQAVSAAIMMINTLEDFNKYLASRFNYKFKIGIGIHTGKVIVGNLGYRKKKEFTAIGDTVNTASRIESLNKKAGTSILISEDTYLQVKDQFKWKHKFSGKVKGKELPVIVYEPEMPDNLSPFYPDPRDMD